MPENNHAVDSAHAAPGAIVFFAALGKINFTRNTGGKGIGNNEYSRDSQDEGGGANYTTFGYGPLGGEPLGVKRRTPPTRSYVLPGRPF